LRRAAQKHTKDKREKSSKGSLIDAFQSHQPCEGLTYNERKSGTRDFEKTEEEEDNPRKLLVVVHRRIRLEH